MLTIHKYEVPLKGCFDLELPADSKILSFQDQRGSLCVWVEVNTVNFLETRTFGIFGTGHQLPMQSILGNYIGTAQQGQYVWHLYELNIAKAEAR